MEREVMKVSAIRISLLVLIIISANTICCSATDQRPGRMIDTTGKRIGMLSFDGCNSCATEGLLGICLTQQDDKPAQWGFVNTKGRMVIAPQFDAVKYFSEGLAPVRIGDTKTGKWGFIDKAGKIVIPPKYSDAWSFHKDLARVVVAKRWTGSEYDTGLKYGFIDKSGKEVVIPQYPFAQDFSEGLALIGVDTGKRSYGLPRLLYGFIDATGRKVISPRFALGSRSFSEGLAAVRTSDSYPIRYGFIDHTGRVLIKPRYVAVGDFHQGYAWVLIKKLDRYGYIDTRGRMVIKPRFAEAGDFAEGVAPAAVLVKGERIFYVPTTMLPKPHWITLYNPTWGYIDKTGKFVIRPRFAYARSFSGRFAVVSSNFKANPPDDFGFIDHKGRYIVKHIYGSLGGFCEGVAVAWGSTF
jgi:hypothetical protein